MSLCFKCTKCKNIAQDDFCACPKCGADAFWHKVPIGTFKERKEYASKAMKNQVPKRKIPEGIDHTLYFHCKKCNYYANDNFGDCPKCGAKDYFWNIEIGGEPNKVQGYIKQCERERKEQSRVAAQQKYQNKLICSKCGAKDAIVTPITETSGKIGSNGVGCLGWLFWIALVPFTFGFILLVPLMLSVRTKGSVSSKTYNRATCQQCGNWWKVY